MQQRDRSQWEGKSYQETFCTRWICRPRVTPFSCRAVVAPARLKLQALMHRPVGNQTNIRTLTGVFTEGEGGGTSYVLLQLRVCRRNYPEGEFPRSCVKGIPAIALFWLPQRFSVIAGRNTNAAHGHAY